MITIKETRKEWESILMDNIIDEHHNISKKEWEKMIINNIIDGHQATECYTNHHFHDLLDIIKDYSNETFTISIMEDSLLNNADREQSLKYLDTLDNLSYLLKLSIFELRALSDNISEIVNEVEEKKELICTNSLIK